MTEIELVYNPQTGKKLKHGGLFAHEFRNPAMGYWLFNPWTGVERTNAEIREDPYGGDIPPRGPDAIDPARIPPPAGIQLQQAEGAARVDTNVDKVLDERGKRYGVFMGHAQITQDLKTVVRKHLAARDKTLAEDQREALDMIFHKIGRIVNGDPDYDDSWVDIAGYAKLVADRLQGKVR